VGELTEWLRILETHGEDLRSHMDKGKFSLNSIVPAVAQLRHTVVHHLYLTVDELLHQIRSAVILTEILQDIHTTSILKALYESPTT